MQRDKDGESSFVASVDNSSDDGEGGADSSGIARSRDVGRCEGLVDRGRDDDVCTETAIGGLGSLATVGKPLGVTAYQPTTPPSFEKGRANISIVAGRGEEPTPHRAYGPAPRLQL